MTAMRSASLTGIFVLLVIYTLHIAASVFLPIYLAILLSFALSPLVRIFQRMYVPAPLGAAFVLVGFAGVAGYFVVSLAQPATEWIGRGPAVFRDIENRLRVLKQPLEQVTKATESVEELATVNTPETPTVQVRQPSLAESLFDSTREFLAQAFLVLVLLYFLLAAAGAFSARLAAAFPQTLGETSQGSVIAMIEAEVSAYLLTVSLINTALGLVVAGAMYLLGMPSPLLWGALAGLLNFVPFVGATVSAMIIAVVALLSFDTLGQAALPPIVFLMLTTVEGFFITPALVGRRLMLNPIAILLAVFIWSWIWGIPGALIAVPTLAILKIVADRIPNMRPVSILVDP